MWAGQWHGWGGRGRSTDYKVVITDVTDIGATIDYAVEGASLAPFYARVNGRFVGDELQGFVGSSATIAFRMRASGELEFLWTLGEAWQAGVFTKVP